MFLLLLRRLSCFCYQNKLCVYIARMVMRIKLLWDHGRRTPSSDAAKLSKSPHQNKQTPWNSNLVIELVCGAAVYRISSTRKDMFKQWYGQSVYIVWKL